MVQDVGREEIQLMSSEKFKAEVGANREQWQAQFGVCSKDDTLLTGEERCAEVVMRDRHACKQSFKWEQPASFSEG